MMKRNFTFLIAAAVMLLTMMATTGEMWGQTYTWNETAITDLATGDYVVIVGSVTTNNTTSTYAMSNDKGTGNPPAATAVTVSNGQLSGTIGDAIQWVITITTTTNNNVTTTSYKFGKPATTISDYLYCTNSNNGVRVGTNNNNSFTYISGGTANNVTQANYLYNTSTSRYVGIYSKQDWRCYTTTPANGNNIANQSFAFYKRVEVQTEDPYITADDVEIAYNATEGSIAYELQNATGNVTAEITSGDWITLGTVTENTVPFTCSANEETTARTAQVTLSYTGATDKVVTVTQAAAPLTTIPAIFEAATAAGSTQTDVVVTFNNWKVVGKSYSNAYVSDGQYGLNLYKSGGINFAIGDQLSGTVATKVQLYSGGAELVGLSTSTEGLTVTHNQTFEPYAISLADVFGQGIYFGSYVDLGNLTYSNGNFTDGNNVITPNNTFSIQNYPTLEAGKTYRVKGVYIQYNNTTKRIAPVYASDFTEFSGPNITLTPAAANPFTYVENHGPSAQQDFTVALENETSKNVTATITTGTDYFEIKNGENWASATTINIDNTTTISVRMKAGLALGNNYAGVMTLTNEDATDVVVNLSGSVTGSTYTIEQYSLPATAHGTITFAPSATVEAGTEVTLTATPDAGYDFTANSWVFYKQSGEDIVVDESIVATNNVITMPAYDIWVDATFTAKPTYAITCVANPVAGGMIEASPASAYQGQTVTLSYVPETGYNLVKIKITKTSDGSITGITPVASGDNFTFTMPAYAVTATATFVPGTYVGNFVKFTGDIVEGDYILTYGGGAMNNTISSSRFGIEDLNNPGNIITDPSTDIVWHIAPSVTDGYWTVYNAKKDQYANGAANGTTVSLVDNPTYSGGAKWGVTKNNNEYRLRCKDNEDYTARYLGRNEDYGFANYGSSYGVNLTLYKYTELTESTITFDGNGGTFNQATTYTQNVYNGVATALTANQFTKANSLFAGWASAADGDVEYADQAEVTINANLNLFAKWNVSYTAMADEQIVDGTVLINGEEIVEAAEGTEMTLTYSANVGYAFSEWNVYKADDETTKVTVTENTFTMPAYDVIVSATFVEVTIYSLITDVSQIVSGKHYIIASGTNGSVKVMAEQKENNRTSVAATATNGIIPETNGIYEFVINGPETITVNNEQVSVYTIYDASYPGFLYAASSSSNYLRTRSTNINGNSQWTITVTEEGVATIKSQGNFTHNWMRNNGNIFACYTGGQADIYLFVKNNDNDLEFYGNVTYAAAVIPDGETLTIEKGSVMTVPAEFTNDVSANLVIEDGGQLIYTGTGSVAATIKRSIAAPAKESNDKWYTISSPVNNVASASVKNLISSTDDGFTYDLYLYNEPTHYWFNQKNDSHEALFENLTNGRGYLYWNSTGSDLEFAGTLNTSDVDYHLTYTDAAGELKGFNLIGNPFSHNIYKGAGAAIDSDKLADGYYTLSNESAWHANIFGAAIAPTQGILVQATEEFDLTIANSTTVATAEKKNASFIEVVASNKDYNDVAYAVFGKGIGLNKIDHLNTEIPEVYFWKNNERFAVASLNEDVEEIALNFKAATEGSYDIKVKFDGDFNYLHLIDNMTGADVDLLATPSYSFEAKTTDYASRFRLVFSANNGTNEDANETFAYFNGSEWVINGTGNATLQVIDVMGRVLRSEQINGNTAINLNQAAGIYMLRLVNGENVMVQKVVVR